MGYEVLLVLGNFQTQTRAFALLIDDFFLLVFFFFHVKFKFIACSADVVGFLLVYFGTVMEVIHDFNG